MPTLTVDHNYFKSHADVMRDISTTGFWPTTYISAESPELPVHYHDYDIIGYVMSGSTYILDEHQQRIEISSGDRLNIPKGAWHAEGEVNDTVTYVVTISEPIAFLKALLPREPQGPWPESLT